MIEVAELSYRYAGADRDAVNGLQFRIEPGRIFGFLGPNGAGKSTTQKILIGLLGGYRGRVTVLGRDVAAWGSEYYERIGVQFEFPNHYLKLTARENLEYFRSLYAGRTGEPEELLAAVDLANDDTMSVSQFSKGMKTRLGIARALLNEPELLFLDEPTTGLDPAGARRVKDLVRRQRDDGRTVFLTTHDMTVARELCDQVAFIVDGAIVAIDAPHELELRHGQPRIRVEYQRDGRTEQREFALHGLADDTEFHELLRGARVRTIHTLEATLEEVFLQLTGRGLS